MSAPSRFAHHLRDSAFRLTRRRRWTVYGVFGVLLLTGLAWLVQHFFTDDGGEGGAVLAWSMKLHGAAAMASLYLFGMLWGPHIRNAWVRRRNRAAESTAARAGAGDGVRQGGVDAARRRRAAAGGARDAGAAA